MRKGFLFVLVTAVLLISCTYAFAAEMKIGYIDARKVFYEYNKTKDFQKELEAKDQQAKDEFEKMATDVRKLRDEIELLSEKAKEKKQNELMEKTKGLNDFRREKGEELLKWRDEKIAEINRDIGNVTTEYAKNNNYDVVINQMALMYAMEKYDITDEILSRLNK
ncbi:MAG: OmpH family outer membrane protein [Candidatus Omnitrophica bacterium]|nr:OmpH family outer membrane protein [Candidatus Omnitrophota bacterium]